MPGVATALALAERGCPTILVDRTGIAEHTSYGNAGLIQCENIIPYTFPRAPLKILRYAMNLAPEAHLHIRALPWLAPWLWSYWRYGSKKHAMATARAARPLVAASASAHQEMARAAGASEQLRTTGYLKVFTRESTLAAELEKDDFAHRKFGITFDTLTPSELATHEPDLSTPLAGAIFQRHPLSAADPQALAKAYASHFETLGGRFFITDVRGVERVGEGWRLVANETTILAKRLVLSLGPWTNDVLTKFGLSLPIAFKRGYHMHYAATGSAKLQHPTMFPEFGFLLAPMARGIRLTTGAEFARRDAPPTPKQITRSELTARQLFPLDRRLDAAPWLGARPCTPDLLPIIGPLPGRNDLWLNTAHHHLGITLGPITARLVADMMTETEPFTNPTPYLPARFF